MPIALTVPQPFSRPLFPPDIAKDVSLILERFPDIGHKIEQAWGSPDLHRYLGTVVFDERGGRQGFPDAVATALFRVYETDRTMIPQAARGDIWDVVLDRLK